MPLDDAWIITTSKEVLDSSVASLKLRLATRSDRGPRKRAMATVGIPDVTEMWQGRFEALSGSTDNMEVLQAQRWPVLPDHRGRLASSRCSYSRFGERLVHGAALFKFTLHTLRLARFQGIPRWKGAPR